MSAYHNRMVLLKKALRYVPVILIFLILIFFFFLYIVSVVTQRTLTTDTFW
jgi:hypothetical protein